MTTLILDWSDWDGPASGWVTLTRRTWRRDPETYQVPWQVSLRVEGRAVADVQAVAGEVVSIRWAPDGVSSRLEHVLVPDDGEHLAHLLERVDPSTLEPLPEDLPSAVDLVARAESLVTRIESGEFTGTDGDDGRGITSVEMVGASARFTWTDGTTQDVDLSALSGDDGDDGVGVESVTLDGPMLRFSLSDGTTRDVDAAALRGKDGHTPNLAWDGTRLVVDGVPGPSLKGDDGHTPVPTWQGTALSWDGGEPVDLRGASGQTPTIKVGTVTSGAAPSATIKGTSPDLTLDLVLAKGDPGTKGDTGAPGALANASSYVLVGPGRPDTPSTTGGVITGSEPVGAEYRSTDGASVGAWTWRKRPTGWAVTDGDTGWREMPAGITSGTVLMNRVRRVGQSVFFMGRIRNDTGSLITWPKIVNTRPAAGFNVENVGPNTPPMAIYLNDASVDAGWEGAFPGWLTSAKHFPAGTNFHWRFSWTTADPWPSAPLPGSPA